MKIFLLVRKKLFNIFIFINIDKVIHASTTNKEIFEELFKPNIHHVLNGINMTIFAYGQTSTGKTYTMQGELPNNAGIIPLTLEEIFEQIKNDKDIIDSQIGVSFIEIYNESINDLLDNAKINLDLRETINKEVIVNNLTEIKIKNHEQALNLLIKGNESRIIASTKLNEKSSRSHCIFRLNIEITKNVKKNIFGEEEIEKVLLKNHINLIDLAGSENSNKTGCVGQRLKEGSNINKSLLALSNVINKLSQNSGNNTNSQNFFVNYRDSKLTRLLQNSLGGNSRTTIICTITDDAEHYNETMNTIHFGNKAKNIKTVVKVNEIKNQNYQQMVLENEKLKKKLKQLEKELTTQKKLNMSEIITKNETNSNIKNRYLNLTAPEKINLNNSFSLCYTAHEKENINNFNNNGISAYKYSESNIHIHRTQLALSNMEKELSFLKRYLLPEQNENLTNNYYIKNNYLDNCSLRSSSICRNLMNNNNFTINKSIGTNYQKNNYLYEPKAFIPENNKIIFCNVENFALNEKKKEILNNNKLKELEEENLRLRNELNLIKNNKNKKENIENININNNPCLDLDESSFEENNNNFNVSNNNINQKQDYFLNKGRKVLLSKYSKIHFIKSLSNKIKSLSKNVPKNDKEDTQILIQLNQTIKNLNQNIISDLGDKQMKKDRDNNGFLKKKTNKNF